MADQEFFDLLIAGIRASYAKDPGQTIRPETVEKLLADVPGAVTSSAAAPAAAATVPEIPASAEETPQSIPECSVKEFTDLESLQKYVLQCRKCQLAATRHHVVFGEGDPHAKLMFIGEGPGFDEDRLGRPFVGRAGQLLDKMIAAMQFQRSEVYIANVVKCRPPDNRVPQPDEACACIGYLHRQIELVKPQVIVLLGATAVNFLLNTRGGITRLRGKWLEYEGIPVMPTYHPAFLLRQESAKREAWSDLQQVMARFGKAYQRRQFQKS